MRAFVVCYQPRTAYRFNSLLTREIRTLANYSTLDCDSTAVIKLYKLFSFITVCMAIWSRAAAPTKLYSTTLISFEKHFVVAK